MNSKEFALASERTLGVTEFGEPDGENVVVLFHPAPGASVFDPDPTVTAEHGVRVIAFDRPGYGTSEPMPPDAWATVAHAAEDAAEYLASEGITSVGAVGWSAGGRVALALAARHPQLVRSLAVVATPAPDADVPWHGDEINAMLAEFAELGPEDAVEAIAASFSAQFDGDEIPTEALFGMIGATAVDGPVLEDAGSYERLAIMLRSSVAQGLIGIASDIAGYALADWGFALASVRAKALLLYGGADAAIGEPHARWYEKRVAGSSVEIVPDAGHLVLVPSWGRVLAHVTA
ncbi:alpha/beta fold hydrolase [Compostimonas suwonensis]|uniref:Pimeloyl-ACP methyl ester carboxylesterase n=1 Tax=Compostimonas suwonensis TaxID=1048394 RepID=A0A2M9C567_9MICO|nr:alpha/beta fold hydrolase [Compostimonas suwonensis]PJJ65617.1 pimeloyl-ACP methyl ester carboxylesterase [Compostimonas suwonensis]